MPLLSERAVRVFQSTAPGCAEYRYFAHLKGKPYFMLNVVATENILDHKRSTGPRNDDGALISVNAYVFSHFDPASVAPLFTMPGQFTSDILCTGAVAEAIVGSKLTGFCLRDPEKSDIKDLFLGKDTNCFPGVRT